MKKDILKDAMKQLNRTMKIWASLSVCAIAASTAYAQNDTTIEVIKEGVEIVICFPDSTIKKDTMTIEDWINAQPQDAEQRNKNLRQLNEQMKKPE